MSINGIDLQFKPIQGLSGAIPSKDGGKATPQDGFGQMLEKAMGEVNDMQNAADKQIEGITTKQAGVTPHEAMLSLEKADVAFQMMSAIRGKIIRAYEEVIRTQV